MPDPISIYRYTITVEEDALDVNGHVNNIQFLVWMQEAAVRHYEHLGGVQLNERLGATWWVRSHKVEYLLPVYAGDRIEVRTWVANLRRVRSLRCYSIIRIPDEQLLVRGETDWVFVNQATGLPQRIPPPMAKLFTIVEGNPQ